jgi:hypothetical protein
VSEDAEQGATGRRWKISLALIGLGVLVLLYGLIDRYVPAIVAGVVLIVAFGYVAAGARKTGVGSPLVRGEADFTAPPPPPPDKVRRIYLPRGWGSKRKR